MNSGDGIDWETIGKGMVDYTTPFGLPAEAVTSLPSYICYFRTNLIGVEFGNVSEIGTSAFQGCSGLTSLAIGGSVATIGGYSFKGCSGLASVTIGNSVTSIKTQAFQDCSGLSQVIINATTPPTLANVNAFNNTNNCPIYVPDGSVNTYKTANVWSGLASRIFSINDLNNS